MIRKNSCFWAVSLWSLGLLIFAQASLAVPVIVRLHPGGKGNETIEMPQKAAELSPTILKTLSRLDLKLKNFVDLPMPDIDKRTLSAIANALMAMQKLKERKIEFKFSSLKSIVKSSCYPSSNPANADELLKFILAADHLAVGDLLKPAEAVWAEMRLGSSHVKELPKELLNHIPTDLANYIEFDVASNSGIGAIPNATRQKKGLLAGLWQSLKRTAIDLVYPSHEKNWEGTFKERFGLDPHDALEKGASFDSIHRNGAVGDAYIFRGQYTGFSSVASAVMESAYNYLQLATKNNVHVRPSAEIDQMIVELEKVEDGKISDFVVQSHGDETSFGLGGEGERADVNRKTASELIDVLNRKLTPNAKIYLATCHGGSCKVGSNIAEVLARTGRTVIAATASSRSSEYDFVNQTMVRGSNRDAQFIERTIQSVGPLASVCSVLLGDTSIGNILVTNLGVFGAAKIYKLLAKPTNIAYKVSLTPRPWTNIASVDVPPVVKHTEILRVDNLNSDYAIGKAFVGKGISADTLITAARGDSPFGNYPLHYLKEIAAKDVVLNDTPDLSDAFLTSDELFESLNPVTEILSINLPIKIKPSTPCKQLHALDLANAKAVELVKDFKTMLPNLTIFTTYRRVWDGMKNETHPGLKILNLESFPPEDVYHVLHDTRKRFPNVNELNFKLLDDSPDIPMSKRIKTLKLEIDGRLFDSLKARVIEVDNCGVTDVRVMLEEAKKDKI